MKFFLIENQQISFNPSVENKIISIITSITSHPSNNDSPEFLSDFEKFKRIFEQKYGNLLKTSPLSVIIGVDPPIKTKKRKPASDSMWLFDVQGDIITALHDILMCGNDPDYAELDIEIIVQKRHRCGHCSQTITASGLLRSPYEDEVFNKYGTMVEVPTENTSEEGFRGGLGVDNGDGDYSWDLSLIITELKFICLEDIVPAFSDTNRKIFEEKLFCDFEIYTDDDKGEKGFFCHKAFLGANSHVFTRMLNSDFKEASQNKMKLKDISGDGVEALLKYLYYSDVTNAMESCNIALELLKAGDKYDIQSLRKVIAVILLKGSNYWYEMDMALCLFEFLRNKEADEDRQKLMKKVIQVMAVKSEELPKSKMYMEIFSTPIARDMFDLALETNKP